jgi:plasmid stability protein
MSQLIVRGIEERVVRRLKERAGADGISMEEAHRQILRDALFPKKAKARTFKEHLLAIPAGGPEDLFRRNKSGSRKVKL